MSFVIKWWFGALVPILPVLFALFRQPAGRALPSPDRKLTNKQLKPAAGNNYMDGPHGSRAGRRGGGVSRKAVRPNNSQLCRESPRDTHKNETFSPRMLKAI